MKVLFFRKYTHWNIIKNTFFMIIFFNYFRSTLFWKILLKRVRIFEDKLLQKTKIFLFIMLVYNILLSVIQIEYSHQLMYSSIHTVKTELIRCFKLGHKFNFSVTSWEPQTSDEWKGCFYRLWYILTIKSFSTELFKY